MGRERIIKLEEEITKLRAKLAQLEAQLEKAKECEKESPSPVTRYRLRLLIICWGYR